MKAAIDTVTAEGTARARGRWVAVGTALVATIVASACAHGSLDSSPPASGGPPEPRLTAPARRITDEAIVGDYRTFDAQQARIRALNAGGVALSDYHLAKAQAYLDFAFDEYHENDRSAVSDRALAEAARLLTGLEARSAALSMTTYPLEGGDGDARPEARAPENRLRPDLWALAERLKALPQFGCAAAATARFEVALLQAIHEDHDGGWRRARPHIETAETLATQAQSAIDRCARGGSGQRDETGEAPGYRP